MGSKPIDGGNYIFTDEEKKEFLNVEPKVRPFFRPYVNAKEFLNGNMRSILALHEIKPEELRKLPKVLECVNAVKLFRLKSSDKGTRKLAQTPTLYHLNVIPDKPFLVIPSTSSERREYVPIAYLKPPPVIPSNATMVIQNASVSLFGLLTSKMHVLWLGEVGGRLKGDYRYSAGMVYNTFPVPDSLDGIEPYTQKILDIREKYPDSTLADLYDPDAMPADLRKTHDELDKAVDRLYRRKPFNSNHERMEYLLEAYDSRLQK